MATKAQDRRKEAVDRVEALSSHLAFCSQHLSEKTEDLKRKYERADFGLSNSKNRLVKARMGIIDYLGPFKDNDKPLDFDPDPKGPELEYWLAMQTVSRLRNTVEGIKSELESNAIKALKKEVDDTEVALEKAKEEAIK